MAKLSNQQIKDAFAKARAAQEKGQLDEAERGYKRLLHAAPGLAEVHFNLGEVLAMRGRLAEAAERFESALKLRPAEPAIWVSYLTMASRHPNPKNFQVLLERSRPALGKTPAFLYFKGVAALRGEDWDSATSQFQQALAGGFKQVRVYADYGLALAELGQHNTALEQYDTALGLMPGNDLVLFRKADLLRNMGQIDEARTLAKRAIAAAPHMGGPYALYTSLGKVAADDPCIPAMRYALKSKPVGDREIPVLGFALAKAMEDSGQTNKVFHYLSLANSASAKAYPYDVELARTGAAQVRALYERFRDLDAPISTAAPIFVTGAPRSGTTLVEQILASHSRVEGAGELGVLQPKVGELLVGPEADWDSDGAVLLAKCAKHADAFGDYIAQNFPGTERITDKSISTYNYIGFLAKVMPKARFVVVRRDPRDNALSIYKNQFKDGKHRYSNDLEHIAFFLRQFELMLDFWRAQCPDAFYEISYEALISDPEAQSKALIAAAGLDWEEECLSFYDTKREVRTLSATQVRQPMYSSSVGAWKRFEKDLMPFLKAYGPVSAASD